ncbi:hypothetical protein [Pyxidicoccus trucidator]|uniref:hypothetical protein n=1 Tax=Pyxidicoccus trucidator TaxID=2709662 RepID=UPI001F07B2F9|nr:hypothetical protein [Pyxidicoccus trucidator]
MPIRTPLLLVASWLVLPGLALAQDGAELTPEKVAEIRRDETQAISKVDAEFGNRKPSEMSNDERNEAIEKQQAASASVLEKHGVSAKDYARYEARMAPEDNARAKAEEKRLEEQAQAAKQAGPTGEKSAEDVAVVNGFSNEDPVEVEAEEGAEPVVDIGIPGAAEAQAMTVETGAAPEEVKPAKRAPARSSAVKKKATKRRRSSRDDS